MGDRLAYGDKVTWRGKPCLVVNVIDDIGDKYWLVLWVPGFGLKRQSIRPDEITPGWDGVA